MAGGYSRIQEIMTKAAGRPELQMTPEGAPQMTPEGEGPMMDDNGMSVDDLAAEAAQIGRYGKDFWGWAEDRGLVQRDERGDGSVTVDMPDWQRIMQAWKNASGGRVFEDEQGDYAPGKAAPQEFR